MDYLQNTIHFLDFSVCESCFDAKSNASANLVVAVVVLQSQPMFHSGKLLRNFFFAAKSARILIYSSQNKHVGLYHVKRKSFLQLVERSRGDSNR